MPTGRRTTAFLGSLSLLYTSLAATADPQVAVDILGVPERLSFPVPAGVNRVLTARIHGAETAEVWLGLSSTEGASFRVPLTKTGAQEFRVNLAAADVHALAATQDSHGEFRVYVRTIDGALASSVAIRFSIEQDSSKFRFPWNRVSLTVYQRTSADFPGSEGRVRMRLGDITAGAVFVTISASDDDNILAAASMREGSALTISLAEESYVVRLDKMVNLLIGEDYAVFTVMPSHVRDTDTIACLLDIMEKSDATFLRNGREFNGRDSAGHLRQKVLYFGPKKLALDRFIEDFTTRSMESGQPYQVKDTEGNVTEMATWLRKQLDRQATQPAGAARTEIHAECPPP